MEPESCPDEAFDSWCLPIEPLKDFFAIGPQGAQPIYFTVPDIIINLRRLPNQESSYVAACAFPDGKQRMELAPGKPHQK